jgi:hypothetical protein
MTREDDLIALFKLDREHCAKVRQVNEDTIASEARSKYTTFHCKECGFLFTPRCNQEKYCCDTCRHAPDKRRKAH